MGRPHTPQSRARLSDRGKRAWQRRREQAAVRPAELERFRRAGIVAPALLPLVALADAECVALLRSLGGDRVSEQRKVLIQDACRLGVVMRGELQRYLATQDSEAATRVASLVSARRASLVAAGLDEHRVEHDLASYLAQRAAERDTTTQEETGADGSELSEPQAASAAIVEPGAAGRTSEGSQSTSSRRGGPRRTG